MEFILQGNSKEVASIPERLLARTGPRFPERDMHNIRETNNPVFVQKTVSPTILQRVTPFEQFDPEYAVVPAFLN